MLNVKIICLGKLKEQYLRDMCAEYVKRLGAMCRINIVELTPVRLSDSPGESEIEAALQKEGKMIISKLDKGEKVIAMCIEGKMLSSEQLSEKIENYAVSGCTGICFVIGSSCGLSNEVKALADFKLSMSPMTFPHQLARAMLLEQIYRAFSISAGSKYHK